MIPEPNVYFTLPAQWRQWLSEKHDSQKVIWLICYKVGSGKPTIPYNELVEEALCYGWIDSTVKGIDEERFARKFTPRTNLNNWSETNQKRVQKLIQEG